MQFGCLTTNVRLESMLASARDLSWLRNWTKEFIGKYISLNYNHQYTWIIQYFIYEYFLDLIGKYLLKLQAPNFGWSRSVVAAVVQVAVVLVLAMPVMPWARWYNGDHTLKQAQWGYPQSCINMSYFCYMDVSENSGTPKSSILIGVFHYNYKPSILGYPDFWKHPYLTYWLVALYHVLLANITWENQRKPSFHSFHGHVLSTPGWRGSCSCNNRHLWPRVWGRAKGRR